jgi:glycosyltransferase involved in cell wall biosynthesis
MMKCVDIIIPHFNRPKELDRSLGSVPNFPELGTIIIVDDSSDPDKVPDIQLLSAKYPDKEISLIHGSLGKGAQYSRITGIMNSRAMWVLFLDSDDTLLDGGIKNLRAHLLKLGDKHRLYFGDFDTDRGITKTSYLRGNCHKQVLRELSLAPFSGLCAHRKSIPVKRLTQNLPSWQDDDFALTMSENFSIYHIGSAIARLHRSSDSISSSAERQESGLIMLLQKWGPSLRQTFGRSIMGLWSLRLIRLRLKAAYQHRLRRCHDRALKLHIRLIDALLFVFFCFCYLALHALLRLCFRHLYT